MQHLAAQEASLRQRIAADPFDHAALSQYGLLFAMERRTAAARSLLRLALAIAPDHAPSWRWLGLAAGHDNDAGQRRRHLRRARASAPLDSETHNREADIYAELGLYEASWRAGERAVAVDPANSWLAWNFARNRLMAGDLETGFRRFDSARYGIPPIVDAHHLLPRPLWRGEDPRGRRVFIASEQGHGDTLFCLRFIAELKRRGAETLLVADPALGEFCRRQPFIDHVFQPGDPLPRFDYGCLPFSLPTMLGLSRDEMLALRTGIAVGPEKKAAWAARLQPGRLNIGIAWAGNPQHMYDHRRSIALERLAGWFDVPGIAWHAVQVGPAMQDIARAGLSCRIADHSRDIAGFDDTAALMAGLDLVVSIDSAPAHLAGVLGVPLWLLLYAPPDWRWGHAGGATPWYPGARLYRQSAAGDWTDVIARLQRDLVALQRHASMRHGPRLDAGPVVQGEAVDQVGAGPVIADHRDLSPLAAEAPDDLVEGTDAGDIPEMG